MSKPITIKKISSLAGVSVGTVDRVLHNRGKVSEKSRLSVIKAMEIAGCNYDVYSSTLAYKREIKIAVATPSVNLGGYWNSIHEGILHSKEEFPDLSINFLWFPYNQFDVYSCREAFSGILCGKPDAVILGSTFADETRTLCSDLDKDGIPYFFVDAIIDGTRPTATYTVDQYACGYILARLLLSFIPEDSNIAIMEMRRVGGMHSNNSVERTKGFKAYLDEQGVLDRLKVGHLSAENPGENEELFMHFFEENPTIKGIAVMNSRGYIIADFLKRTSLCDVKLICFDLTTNNLRCITDGSITALLGQRPELQGFHVVKAAVNHLIYKRSDPQPNHLLPIDIILKENLPFYKELFTG